MAATSTIALASHHLMTAESSPCGKSAVMSSSPLPSPSQLFSTMPHRPSSGSRPTATSVDGLPEVAVALGLLGDIRSSCGDGAQRPIERPILEKRSGLGSDSKMLHKMEKPKAEKKAPTFKKPGVSQEQQIKPLLRDVPVVEFDEAVSSAKSLGIKDPKKSRGKKSKDKDEAAQANDSTLTSRKSGKKGSKEDCQTQTRIKKTRITKPGALKSSGISKKTAATTGKSQESIAALAEPPVGSQAEDFQAREEFRGLCLERAVPSRRERIPVKDTIQAPDHSDNTGGSATSIPHLDARTSKSVPATYLEEPASDLETTRTKDGLVSSIEETHRSDGEAMVKRRKIELVDSVSGSAAERLQRGKSPKKKPQTITGKATAPFVPAEISKNPSLLQYFGTSAPETEASTAKSDESKTPRTVRRKSTGKKTAKARSIMNKVNQPRKPTLLSPESAMKTVQNQELLFGTSSQLAREDSPTLLKELQQTMKESELMDDDWGLSMIPSAKFKPYNSLALTRSKDLWSVASRDSSGSLLDAEVVDLSITPKPSKIIVEPESKLVTLAMKVTGSEPVAQEHGVPSALIAEIQSAPILDLDETLTLQEQSRVPQLIIPRSIAEAALKKRPKSKSPVKERAVPKLKSDQMPNYKGFTDVQLSQKVASYGFKSIKRREAMIVLLERCWESQVALVLQEVPVSANIPQPTTSNAMDEQSKRSSPVKKKARSSKAGAAKVHSVDENRDTTPKKPRGRPKKDPSTTTSSPKPKPKPKRKVAASERCKAETAVLTADEIYDSSPPTPSPPRRRSPPKSPAQLPLSQPLRTSNFTKLPLENAAQSRLFGNITRAIKTFPPSGDPRNLTFHEKMLMYEPVVLEDLASWLNAEGLDRVGEDDQVSPDLVKEWCEARSVCCLWRENLRGGTRSRW